MTPSPTKKNAVPVPKPVPKLLLAIQILKKKRKQDNQVLAWYDGFQLCLFHIPRQII